MKYFTAGSNHICRRETIVYSLGFALATIIAINCMSYERDAVGQQIPLQPFFNNSDTNTAKINDINNNNILDLQSQALNKLFKQVEGSVVEINVDLGNDTGAIGSGFIYNTDGYIITNNHVVDGAVGGKVDVTFLDGNTYTAKVVGTDSIEDIGVIQIIDDYSAEHLVPLSLGNSSGLQVGQVVIAIGNPLGLSDSMTMGIISQVGRLFPTNTTNGFAQPDVIQTDAAINHGNSGGPLLNSKGQLVGITAFIKSNSTGLNFAIPSNLVARMVPALIKNGSFNHPWLGLNGIDLTPDSSESLGLSRSYKGVTVVYVTPGGPADKAGIQAQNPNSNDSSSSRGDIIKAIDGHAVRGMEDVTVYLEEHKSVGDNITLTIDRDGQNKDLSMSLQSRPPLSSPPSTIRQ